MHLNIKKSKSIDIGNEDIQSAKNSLFVNKKQSNIFIRF